MMNTTNNPTPSYVYGITLYDLYLTDLGKEINGKQALLYFLCYTNLYKNDDETYEIVLEKVKNMINKMHQKNPESKKQNLNDLFKKYSSNNAESKAIIQNILIDLKDSGRDKKKGIKREYADLNYNTPEKDKLIIPKKRKAEK